MTIKTFDSLIYGREGTMPKCAFFGHADFNYDPYAAEIEKIIKNLIESGDVCDFYSGGRGNFDLACEGIVAGLKKIYPKIKLTRVLSYIPEGHIDLPAWCDGSVYLLEKSVYPRYAISATNRLLAEMCDYIISGVFLGYGGAHAAVAHAINLNKKVIKLRYGAGK